MKLIACSACSRQYDVTHLKPGASVRCSCDELLTVNWRKPLGVEALACRHCAGAVKADDDTCPWCGVALSAQDRRESTLCPACWARIEDEAKHCRSCGIAIAPQALTPIREGVDCPRCKGPLLNRSLGITDVIECGDCGGLWLLPEVFQKICHEAEQQRDPVAFSSGPPLRPVTETGVVYIPCPTCDELMIRKQFRKGDRASGVIIDLCKNHGVWLDRTELERITDYLRKQPSSVRTGAWEAFPKRDVPRREGMGNLDIPLGRGSGANGRMTDALWWLGDLLDFLT